MTDTANPADPGASANEHHLSPGQRALASGQRALATARQLGRFAPDFMQRQMTGFQAPDGARGKAAAMATAAVNVRTRAVEQAMAVLNRGAPELVQAVDAGKDQYLRGSEGDRVARRGTAPTGRRHRCCPARQPRIGESRRL